MTRESDSTYLPSPCDPIWNPHHPSVDCKYIYNTLQKIWLHRWVSEERMTYPWLCGMFRRPGWLTSITLRRRHSVTTVTQDHYCSINPTESNSTQHTALTTHAFYRDSMQLVTSISVFLGISWQTLLLKTFGVFPHRAVCSQSLGGKGPGLCLQFTGTEIHQRSFQCLAL